MRCSVRGGRKVHPDAGDRSLPARMRALEDILAYLLAELEQGKTAWLGTQAMAERNREQLEQTRRLVTAVTTGLALANPGHPAAAAAAGARHAAPVKAKRD